MAEEYWNHNVHYHALVLGAVVRGPALDLGCGEGLLVRRLARRVDSVTGVDASGEMIRLAHERSAGLDNVTFVEADFLDDSRGLLPEGRYGFVSAVAVIHHVRFGPALQAIERLLAPGGRLVIVGLARNRTPLDWIVSAAGVPVSRLRARPRRQDRRRRHAHDDAPDELGRRTPGGAPPAARLPFPASSPVALLDRLGQALDG